MYPSTSLPAIVAGLSTTCHHDPTSFFSSIRDCTRKRVLDPNQYLLGPQIELLPQDETNYLYEPDWGIMSPGVRVSTGPGTDTGTYANAILSMTCGVLLQKGDKQRITVANHRFLGVSGVFHPGYNGDKIGDIINRYPKLNIAMVQLTPANSNQFSNATYFQAKPPKQLVEVDDLEQRTWFKVDGMSTGLLSFQYMWDAFKKPFIIRPPGHPETPVLQWRQDLVFQVFGAANPELMDGICGASLVEVRTGNVAGFFSHLASGDWAECAALDDLVAEGWEVQVVC